ncbi:MAG: YjgN family protein [Nitrospira sp.]|nr:YjgN family protein [Nitrospira sp.]
MPGNSFGGNNGGAPLKNASLITRRFSFLGNTEALFEIALINLFLTLATCGIYMFWAKVRIRRYLFEQTKFGGDPFCYHGTGPELFRGYLKATLVFGIPYTCLTWGPTFLVMDPLIQTATMTLGFVLIAICIPVAIVGARQYRLTRTSWRGIRFSFVGSTWAYVKFYTTSLILTVITVGAYATFFDAKSQAFLVSHSYIGNQSFSFDGNGWDMITNFWLAILLTPFTLGLSWFWFSAWRKRYFWEHTSFAEGWFTFTGTGGELCRLKLVNFFLLVFTLGFAWPWTTIRNARFLLDHLTFTGPTDLDTLAQALQSASPTGDGLDVFLNIGFDLA